jgi:hypothetical protein
MTAAALAAAALPWLWQLIPFPGPGPVPASGPAMVQYKVGTCTIGASSCTVSITPAAGNLVVAITAVQWTDVTSVTSIQDNLGNSYTLATTRPWQLGYRCSAASGTTSITANYQTASTADPGLIVVEVRGLSSSSRLDSDGAYDANTSTSLASASNAPAGAGELSFGPNFLSGAIYTPTTLTGTSGYTCVGPVPVSFCGVCWKVLSGSGANQVTATIDPSTLWYQGQVFFK